MRRWFSLIAAALALAGLVAMTIALTSKGGSQYSIRPSTPVPVVDGTDAPSSLLASQGDDPAVKASFAAQPAVAAPSSDPNRDKVAEADFFARYNAYLDSPAAANLDLRALPRGVLSADYPAGAATLREAVSDATTIVVGQATGYRLSSHGNTIEFRVDRVLKGPATTSLAFVVPGGPQPIDNAFTQFSLVEAESAPFLLPGDSAVLFLQTSQDGSHLYPAPSTGTYTFDAGNMMQALSGNPFSATVNGTPLSAFQAEIVALR